MHTFVSKVIVPSSAVNGSTDGHLCWSPSSRAAPQLTQSLQDGLVGDRVGRSGVAGTATDVEDRRADTDPRRLHHRSKQTYVSRLVRSPTIWLEAPS